MRTALITGGGGAIGRAIALKLGAAGFAVAVADLDEEAGHQTVEALRRDEATGLFVNVDVSSGSSFEACVDHVEKCLGPIEAFANNAGIEGAVSPIHHYPDDAFDATMRVNVRGVFLGLKYVLARMMPRGTGAIVNTGSTSSVRGRAGLAGYVASKHAVLGLTKVAALDVAGTQIRVNAVLPGPINSRMITSITAQAEASGAGLRRAGNAVLGTPESVAAVVAFLLSSEASHVNGAAWTVDAGSTVS
jgi:NAD(P)-dependent dehydrogenase (short-subunit alcohol dehydrogenase family)